MATALTNASVPILNTNDLIPGSSQKDASFVSGSVSTTRFNVSMPVFDRKDKFRANPATLSLTPSQSELQASNGLTTSSSNINGDNASLISTFQIQVQNAVEINPMLNIKNPRSDRVLSFKRNKKFVDTTTNAEGIVGNTTNLAPIPFEKEDSIKQALRVAKNINKNTNNSLITSDLFDRIVIQQSGNIRAMPRDRSQGLEYAFLRIKMLSLQQAVSDLSNPAIPQGMVSFVTFSARDPGLPPILSQNSLTGPQGALKALL